MGFVTNGATQPPTFPDSETPPPGLPPVATMAEAVSCSPNATAAIRPIPDRPCDRIPQHSACEPGGTIGAIIMARHADYPVQECSRPSRWSAIERHCEVEAIVYSFCFSPVRKIPQQVGGHQQRASVFQKPGALPLQAVELVEGVEQRALDSPCAGRARQARSARPMLPASGRCPYPGSDNGLASSKSDASSNP